MHPVFNCCFYCQRKQFYALWTDLNSVYVILIVDRIIEYALIFRTNFKLLTSQAQTQALWVKLYWCVLKHTSSFCDVFFRLMGWLFFVLACYIKVNKMLIFCGHSLQVESIVMIDLVLGMWNNCCLLLTIMFEKSFAEEEMSIWSYAHLSVMIVVGDHASQHLMCKKSCYLLAPEVKKEWDIDLVLFSCAGCDRWLQMP